jgi:hypothetical protein
MYMIIPTEVPQVDAVHSVVFPFCSVCAAARVAWRRGGAHLCCRACELRSVAGCEPAARHAFYQALVALVDAA